MNRQQEIIKTDPICGMQGTIPAYNHYFCSPQCITKYEQQNISKKQPCPTCDIPKKKWYQERLYIITIIIIILLGISNFISILQPFFIAFVEYLKLIWWAILLGFIIGGIIDYFIPPKYIEKYLSRHRKRTIIYSIIFGFFMSACSHGILAIAIALYKKGANTSSIIAFLLASPWANLPITILLFGFFGYNALLIIFSAIFIAFTTGLIYLELEKKGMVECSHCIHGEDQEVLKELSIIKDVKVRWKKFSFTQSNIKKAFLGTIRGSWSLTKMIFWWLLVGMLLAAFARAYVSHDFFMYYMGPTVLGLVVTLIFAIIIEVCSEGSSPLAFEIFSQTGAFGNSFTFLMAGVATDYTEIGIIWQNIGKKAALWLPIITVPQILILAYIFNILF